jgi:molybdenum storage protein
MRESLVNREVVARTGSEREYEILPHVNLISLGGRSIFDRGRSALLPLVDEIATLRRKYPMVIGVGGGTRVRHTASVALDLGLPIGGVAQLVGAMEECNAVFLNALLAKHGSLQMPRDHFWELSLYIDNGMIPIVISTPPYHFWEPPPERGALPAHGSDFGLFMLAEVLGMKKIIFVKDQDGLFDRDPARHADARFIPRATLAELEKDMPKELILDELLFDAWKHARHVERVQIINGLIPDQLTKALAGEDVGTVLTKEKRA